MKTPVIKLLAYEDRDPHWVFVAVPDERARYVRTERCVVEVWCPQCQAARGEPCKNRQGYGAGVHYTRRDLARQQRRDEQHPPQPRVLHLDEAHFDQGALPDVPEFYVKFNVMGEEGSLSLFRTLDATLVRTIPASEIIHRDRGAFMLEIDGKKSIVPLGRPRLEGAHWP